jgi:hypothetical protein
VTFWQKNMGAKAASKMLMKMTKEYQKSPYDKKTKATEFK